MSGTGAVRIAKLDTYSRKLLHLVPDADALRVYDAFAAAAVKTTQV